MISFCDSRIIIKFLNYLSDNNYIATSSIIKELASSVYTVNQCGNYVIYTEEFNVNFQLHVVIVIIIISMVAHNEIIGGRLCQQGNDEYILERR